MRYAGVSLFGRIATWLAACVAPPFYGRCYLADYNPRGYVSPSASLYASNLRLGAHVFISDRVVIYQEQDGGSIELSDHVYLHDEVYLQTGHGGSIMIGAHTHVQPRCQFSAYKASIQIGCGVQIAPACAFYPYDHGFSPGALISRQPLETKGAIIVEDDAWLGYGVIVLSGVRIGKGAVIGAGAVVTRDVPDGAVAVGVPARVLKTRRDLALRGSRDDAQARSVDRRP